MILAYFRGISLLTEFLWIIFGNIKNFSWKQDRIKACLYTFFDENYASLWKQQLYSGHIPAIVLQLNSPDCGPY